MKVSLSTNVFLHSKVSQNKNKSSDTYLLNSLPADTFVKSGKNVSFGYSDNSQKRVWNEYKFNPLEASDRILDEYAEIFHKFDIDEIISERYPVGLFTSGRKEKQRIAQKRLKPRVQKVVDEKRELLLRNSELLKKMTLGESNIVKQKLAIQKRFLTPLELINEGNEDKYLPNGIFIYGSADTKDKHDFVNWIKTEALESKTGYKEILYKENPDMFLTEISKTLDANKAYYNNLHKHSIVYLNGADKLMSDKYNQESLDYINDLKQVLEKAAKDYHTTFIVLTDLSKDSFDDAVIGKHRFPLQLFLKDGIQPQEEEELEKIKTRLDHLEKMAARADDYYQLESYDDEDYFLYRMSHYD